MPIFDAMEGSLQKHVEDVRLWMRWLVRVVFTVGATFIAVSLPFFGKSSLAVSNQCSGGISNDPSVHPCLQFCMHEQSWLAAGLRHPSDCIYGMHSHAHNHMTWHLALTCDHVISLWALMAQVISSSHKLMGTHEACLNKSGLGRKLLCLQYCMGPLRCLRSRVGKQ